jgi:outer membrane lipoprotein LolB
MHISRLFPAIIAAAILSGCATTSIPTGIQAGALVAPYSESIDLSGKLSVRYQKDGQPENIIGNFTWTQRPGRIDVSLSSPLSTIAEISVTPQAATLTQANRAPRVAKDIDALTEQALGWQLPVAGLRDWLQGYATDAQGNRFTASPANNNVFTRDGWRLRFAEWQDKPGPNGAPLPKLIIAERSATATSGELGIRISIHPAG